MARLTSRNVNDSLGLGLGLKLDLDRSSTTAPPPQLAPVVHPNPLPPSMDEIPPVKATPVGLKMPELTFVHHQLPATRLDNSVRECSF